ncbi:MAG: hypothetical protein R3Y43_03065 [Alphaproteobacteria bacterium]
MAKKRKALPTPSVVLISDANIYVDDLLSFVYAAYLADEKKINLKGVIATGGIQDIRFRRARFTKGVFMDLKHPFVKVSYGANYAEEAEEKANFYADTEHARALEIKGSVVDGKSLLMLQTILKTAEDKEIILVINAQMSDVSGFIKNISLKNIKRIKKVIVMGDVLEKPTEEGFFLPDEKSYNNASSMSSAKELYQFLQENKISLTLVNKECAKKVSVNQDFYEEIQKTNHLISSAICNGYKEKFENFCNLYDVLSVVACVDADFKAYGHFDKLAEDKAVFRAIVDDADGLRELIKERILTKLKPKKIVLKPRLSFE